MIRFTRKGEWLDIRLPIDAREESNVAAVAAEWLRLTPKELGRLRHAGGLERKGDHLRLRLFVEESTNVVPEWLELDVLYEDDFCLVVSKPAGMPVHPTELGGRGTLANAVAAYFEATGQACNARHIHRLDADTTGPVLYAKNEYAHIRLDEAMRSKTIQRTYLALAQGLIQRDLGTIDAPIGRDRHHPSRRRVSSSGDQAVSHYEVVSRYEQSTLVRIRLETGRTHQIRVHMSYLGHPLVGDLLYGGPKSGISRQALHGESLRFHHPLSQELIETPCPLPIDFQSLLENLN